MTDWIVSGFAIVILIRCGCVLNRMKRAKSWPLGIAYIGLALSAMAVAVAPLYKFEWLGYYTIVIFTAGVLVFDPRLWRRENR